VPDRRARIGASVRARPDEIRLAADCQVDELFIIFPVSALHRESRLGLDLKAWKELGKRCLDEAHQLGMVTNLVLEDASRATLEDMSHALHIAREEGAGRVMVCDTVGVLTPARSRALVAETRKVLGPGVEIGLHFHNDFGMGTANTIAAIEAGASWPSVTVNGVGERAGNAVLAEVTMACEELLGIPTGIARDSLADLSREVELRTGVYMAPDAPIVGHTSFTHESGIHVDGVLKQASTYEAMLPQSLKRMHRITYGKHTGRAALRAFAKQAGLNDSAQAVDIVLARLKALRPAWYGDAVKRFIDLRDRYLDKERGISEDILRRLFMEVDDQLKEKD
jgi:isopropylmalate/homocitrate/citramalate synthase